MEEQYKNHAIKIQPDEDTESPREWSNLGQMVCFHRNYNLGDKHDYKTEDYQSWKELAKAITENEKPVMMFPLYLYDHSGLSIKIGDFCGLLPQGHASFDSGQVGFIFARSEDTKTWYEIKRISKKLRGKIEKTLRNEVEIYNTYLSGQVVGFVVEDQEGNHVDSCWGFYDEEQAIEEAKDRINWKLEEETKKKAKRTKAYIKQSLPMIYRHLT